jgi:hypothetical protein
LTNGEVIMTRLNDQITRIQFLTVINSVNDIHQARFLVESLRAFGGNLRDCPVWIFQPEANNLPEFSGLGEITPFCLEIEAPFRHYELAEKVFACAQAEEMAVGEARSLVWLNLDCLVVNPPVLFDLGTSFDVALRPVHIRNVGSAAGEPMDEYWERIYQMVEVKDVCYSVESFVDSEIIRPYYNTHCFSVNPSRRILQAWRECFKMLVSETEFQAGPCQDELHRIFLHQAVLSALITKNVVQERIRMLPPEYSYPLHLLDRLPVERCFPSLNQTVCAVYEESEPIGRIEVQEPLKSWLKAHR